MSRRTGRSILVTCGFLTLAAAHCLHAPPALATPSSSASSAGAQAKTALWNLATLGTAGGILAACPVSGLQPLDQQPGAMRGILSATATVLTPGYTALKAAVAGAGIGAGYWMMLLSFDQELARGTIETMGKGDWRLRAGHLTCEEPIHLLAPKSTAPSEREAPMPP